jgi:predicted glycogen debranching enzyme
MYGAALSGRGKGAGAVGADDARAVARLAAAADAYVVKRRAPGAAESSGPADAAAIIAGYPWFGSWGRDTCISMFGLLLATGRHAEAGAALRLYAGHRRNGIVPNLFDDRTGEPHYNTVDASLWFVLAACRHFALTGDRASWDGTLLPACLDVVAHYRRGTDFNIAMDPMDKLVTAGTAATQLTWMDAKRNGVTFTPRHGKAVEVNALWHAALRELSLAVRETDAAMAANLGDLAEAVARSFRAAFWNGARGCLHDCLSPKEGESGWRPIDEVRPNQLLAVSLGHGLLTKEQQRGVVGTVRERLLTPMGVRTLDPADPRYRGRTEGDMMARDGAYHNGTAWPWLLGPYAEAVLRAGDFSESAKREARAALWPVVEAMGGLTGEGAGGCLGQIAEIFDAEAPQRAQGCTAQAWSVAEVLRVLLMVV